MADRVPYQQPYQQPRQQLSHPSVRSTRLSLALKNISTQHENGARVLSNAENHFRFTQNLREGVPLVPKQNNRQAVDTIGQLANAMLMQNSATGSITLQSIAPPRGSELNATKFFSGHANSKLGQLQHQKQQITPPFNLGRCLPPTLQ